MPSFDREDAKNGRCSYLEINTETLDEHQERLRREGRAPLTREEAETMFPAQQVEWHFGPKP